MEIKRQADPHDLVIEKLDPAGLYLVSGPELPTLAVDKTGCAAVLRTACGSVAAGMIADHVLPSCGRFMTDLQPEQLREVRALLTQ